MKNKYVVLVAGIFVLFVAVIIGINIGKSSKISDSDNAMEQYANQIQNDKVNEDVPIDAYSSGPIIQESIHDEKTVTEQTSVPKLDITDEQIEQYHKLIDQISNATELSQLDLTEVFTMNASEDNISGTYERDWFIVTPEDYEYDTMNYIATAMDACYGVIDCKFTYKLTWDLKYENGNCPVAYLESDNSEDKDVIVYFTDGKIILYEVN